MAVDVGARDLVRAYQAHLEATETTGGGCCHLLLFYAVECGLKAAYLRRRSLSGTGKLPDRLRNHDIRKLAEELCLPPQYLSDIRSCTRRHDRHDRSARVDVQELHEAWRYGATLDHDDEKRVTDALAALAAWCRKEHGR